MSGWGQELPSRSARMMSVIPPTTDIAEAITDVGEAPQADFLGNCRATVFSHRIVPRQGLERTEWPIPSHQSGLCGLSAAFRDRRDGDYEIALRLWQPLAERGDPRAENNLGVLYEKGLGVAADHESAADWYRRAAAHGHAGALNNLADLIAGGLSAAPPGLPAITSNKLGAPDWYVACEQHPDFCTGSWYYNDRGIARWNKGDYDRAMADFDLAVRAQLNPHLRSGTTSPPQDTSRNNANPL